MIQTFEKFDVDRDGVWSDKEFAAYCKKFLSIAFCLYWLNFVLSDRVVNNAIPDDTVLNYVKSFDRFNYVTTEGFFKLMLCQATEDRDEVIKDLVIYLVFLLRLFQYLIISSIATFGIHRVSIKIKSKKNKVASFCTNHKWNVFNPQSCLTSSSDRCQSTARSTSLDPAALGSQDWRQSRSCRCRSRAAV